MSKLYVDAPDRTIATQLLYTVCRWIILVLGTFIWGVRAHNTARVPKRGPVILAPSHRSFFDIPFMAFVTNRPSRFMGKEELFSKPALNGFIQALGAFPVKRGTADRAALNFARQTLDLGAPVVLFPEGTRCHGPVIEHIEEGVAYLAMKTGATIVPVGVAGTEPLLEKGRLIPHLGNVNIEVGEPIAVAKVEGRLDRDRMQALVEQIRGGLQAAFDDANAALAAR